MLAIKENAWSKSNCPKTLAGLKRDFPRYTDNELYAIWCNLHGLIPKDLNGKLELELWKAQANQDGINYQDEGFRVSRALYGRALKSKKGQPKPPRKTKVVEPSLKEEPIQSKEPEIGFAKEYHQAASVVFAIIEMRAEILELLKTIGGLDRRIAAELGNDSPRVSGVIGEARNLAYASRTAKQ